MSNSLTKMLNLSTISFGGLYTFTITYFCGYGAFCEISMHRYSHPETESINVKGAEISYLSWTYMINPPCSEHNLPCLIMCYLKLLVVVQ